MTSILRTVTTIITLAALATTIGLAVAYWRWAQEIAADAGRLVGRAVANDARIITDAMLADLPDPARRYLVHAGVVGSKMSRLVTLTQRGRIRNSIEASWMAFEAEETYSTSPPGFVWRAAFPATAIPIVLGRDEYLDGAGSIVMKMLAAMPVAEERGEELAAAGLMRYLNEMMWFPAAFLGSNVTITAIDDASFSVSIADRGMVAEATLFIDPSGQLTNFRARRYNTGSRRMEIWETPIVAYRNFNGLLLPSAGSAVWKLDAGDLDYIELEITSVTYQ
jgi:hypothetical protein